MTTDASLAVPKYFELMNPALRSLRTLGGSASIREMEAEVARDLQLSEEAQGVVHGRMTLLGYRLAWSRFYLKVFGLMTNSKRGVWALTIEGTRIEEVDPREVVRVVGRVYRKSAARSQDNEDDPTESVVDEAIEETEWKEQLLEILQALSPTAFEKLCLRVLRESGFTEVGVTQRGADGGIDGHGIVRLQGLVSLPVVYQAKRWTNPVGAPVVRDFRGSMAGRADKGLIITTSTFTSDARIEASRAGAALIDLVDRDRLVELLLELGLGTSTETVERVRVHRDYFESLE